MIKEIRAEKRKIKFKDLNGWLKALVILISILMFITGFVIGYTVTGFVIGCTGVA